MKKKLMVALAIAVACTLCWFFLKSGTVERCLQVCTGRVGREHNGCMSDCL